MKAETGRPDYDETIKLTALDPGEPIFVVRGRDALAGDAVRGWAALAARAGAPLEAVELALKQADRMDAWPVKRLPDGPDLSDADAKQLRYEHSRRAWAARDHLRTADSLLAVQLGRDQIIGQLRGVLAELSEHLSGDEDGRSWVRPSGGLALRKLFALVGQDVDARSREASVA